ncbi:hypothetical protein L3X38_037436 [Prunus dulcis]|uniref:Pectin lyase-like superfamily protein n=1 Tax=Prunus dulcis TaxID=3755 RepID=A0AAD4V3D2_PRUDU|nr:hypothetical protein L3X38_037436 [Prunus dulcis]
MWSCSGYSKWFEDWARPSNGFVQGVQFLDVVMINVQNPIVIDQNYCPHNINCPAQVSGVKRDKTLENVSLTCRNQEVQSHCANAIGKIVGTVQPNSCL